MGKYNEFSIESALNTKPVRSGYKLNGMKKFAAITVNPSRSTEEFISGAISCLGQADRTIMYTTMSLEALNDRLTLAAKIAMPINKSKSRGVEGFKNVPYLNPWEYAIEGKIGDFFKKILSAIQTSAVKILEAIQNFIRWIGNSVKSIAITKQQKDYTKWKELIKNEDFNNKIKASKVDDFEIKTLPWKSAKEIGKASSDFCTKFSKIGADDEGLNSILKSMSTIDLKKLKEKENIIAAFNNVFGKDPKAKIEQIHNSFQTKLNLLHVGKENAAYKGANPHEYVKSKLLNGDDKISQKKLSEIKTLSGDFGVLDNAWLVENAIKKMVAAVHSNEKDFSQFVSNFNKFAAKFEKSENTPAENSILKSLAEISKLKCALNSCFTTAAIDLTSYILRFRKTCHIALKAYLRAGGKKEKKVKESKESLQSIESMFAFDN